MKKYRVILEQMAKEFENELNKLYSQGYVIHIAHSSSDEDGLDYYVAIMELSDSEGSPT